MALSDWNREGWLEVSEKLKFELPPIGVSFAIDPPDGLEKLEEKIGFCEMLRQAQEGNAFYAAPENHNCDGGLVVLGKTVPPVYESGEFGAGLQVFDHYRTMTRVYDVLPRLNPERNISYVAFSPLDSLTFEPDLLVVVADIPQAEILLRAMSYSTGKVWTSRCTTVLGCAWMYIYPYLTGELNYIPTGLGHGMTRRAVAPAGRQVISIPYDLFGTMLYSLQTMPWVAPLFQPDADEFRQKLLKDLGLDSRLYKVEDK